MKKIMAVILAVLMCFSFVSCGGEEPDMQSETNSQLTQTDIPAPEITDTETDAGTDTESAPRVQEIVDYLSGLKPSYDRTVVVDGQQFRIVDYEMPLGQETLIEQYIATVSVNCKDMQLVDIYSYKNDDKDVTYTYYYVKYEGDSEKYFGSEMDYHINIAIVEYATDARAEISFGYVKGFEFADEGYRADFSKVVLKTPAPKPTPEPTEEPVYEPPQGLSGNTVTQPSQPVETVDKNASPVPDFTAFLGRNPTEDKDRYYGGTRKYYQKLSLDTQSTVVSEVLNLLGKGRYQLELIEKVESDDTIEYNYRYTGNVSMDSIHSKNDDTRYYNLQFTVYNRNNKNGTYSIHFHYSPQFVEENVGYTVSSNISGGGGGGGGGGGTPDFEGGDVPEFSKLPCLTCNGTKDCPSCSGRGYNIVDDIKEDCTRCNRGTCPKCKGSGVRN